MEIKSMNQNEHDDNQNPPEFLRRQDEVSAAVERDRDIASSIEKDMEFVIKRARGLSTDPMKGPEHYAPRIKTLPAPPPNRFKIASPEAEQAALKLAEQAKTVVTQTSTVVRRAISELQRELKELDDILIAHEKQSHDMIDDHLKVSTEVAGSVLAIREVFETWRKKVERM
jgi:hypothetical protein